jgi:uncharacterized repeat protein (TIGR03943 family)
VRRETQNVLLILLGGAVLKIAANGEYLRYVKPWLLPWLIAAGVITVLLAGVGIARDIQAATARAHGRAVTAGDGHAGHDGHGPAGAGHDGHGHAGEGHGHSSHSPWLLLLPVLAILLIAPPALGADKVARSGDLSAVARQAPSGSAAFDQLPTDDAPLLKIGDAVTRAVWDSSGSLDGRQIRLVGFVVHMPDGSVDLARLVINCCAADAIPIKVRLDGDAAHRYPPDTWLEARGEIVAHSATEGNGYVPVFKITSLTEVTPPPDPYES